MSHSSRPALQNNSDNRSDINTPMSNRLRSLSPEDLSKLKYKIDLDKQVAEKQQRLTREWEKKIEHDKKYVRNQPFGRHEHTTVINQRELDEILTKGTGPSPILEMPQEYPIQQRRTSYMSNGGSNYPPNQPMNYNNYGPPMPTQSPSNYPNDGSSNNNPNFQRFYGPHTDSMASMKSSSSSTPTNTAGTTAQPVKGDAHDPFILYDPNKEGQNVFNIIPQQDLYDPWGRPGGGAPLIHQPTGQRFTRYSGSLQDKLSTVGPLGFHRRHYNEDIQEQKRDLEMEKQRRQQEDMEHRSNAGDTAGWISHLESSRYPLKFHLPTTQTTREYIGAHGRYRADETRMLHDDLVRQASERAHVQKLNRFQNNIAELQHTEAQNSWWGRSGGGAPVYNNRRHNVNNSFENPRQKWTINHLGQLTMAEADPSNQVEVYSGDYYYPKTKGFSSHKNYYQMAEDERS